MEFLTSIVRAARVWQADRLTLGIVDGKSVTATSTACSQPFPPCVERGPRTATGHTAPDPRCRGASRRAADSSGCAPGIALSPSRSRNNGMACHSPASGPAISPAAGSDLGDPVGAKIVEDRGHHLRRSRAVKRPTRQHRMLEIVLAATDLIAWTELLGSTGQPEPARRGDHPTRHAARKIAAGSRAAFSAAPACRRPRCRPRSAAWPALPATVARPRPPATPRPGRQSPSPPPR